MKYWRIIAISFLTLAPLACFAVISQYENPLGCGITSLPQFIKGVLTIIVKVGIPVATLFIIWSGFLFLTAQGNEAKLTKAKHSFVWACIGTAVLLGAWLLATAINATIQSIGGGTNGGGSSTTVDGGCGKEAQPTGDFFWPDPVHLTQSELLTYEKSSKIGKDNLNQCADFYSLLFLDEKLSNDVLPNTTLSSDNTSTLKCSYDTGVVSIQSNLNGLSEQALLWVQYKDGTSKWIHAGVGQDGSVDEPTALLESLSKNAQVATVYNMHTHPYQSQSNLNTKYSAPSLTDLVLAYRYAGTYDQSIFSEKVIASGIVWQYNVDQPNLMHNAIQEIQSKTELLFSNSTDASKAFSDEYGKLSNHGKVLWDKNDLSTYSQALCKTIMRAGKGDFGADAEKNAGELQSVLNKSPLLKYQFALRASIGSGIGDYQTYAGGMLNAASDLGVLLATEMHPYSWCKKP